MGPDSAFSVDKRSGRLAFINRQPTHGGLASHRAIDAGGRMLISMDFVCVSNRGDENDSSVAVFARNSQNGTLSLVQIMATDVHCPRSFALSPDGRWLLCANQETDKLSVFGVDPANGRLKPAGKQVAISQPVCVLFCN
jgi:6-phosphogluconolactonase